MTVQWYFGEVGVVRLLLQRGLGALYLIAFWAALRQGPALLGERGLLPIPDFLARSSLRSAPSLFHWRYSDRLFRGVCRAGLALAAAAALGLTAAAPLWLGVAAWLLLWALYLSIVNVGQSFYGFGWESMLLEAGFFVAFLGPSRIEAPLVPVLCLRWMLFRTELGAGLIKLRHDSCWRDLTCLYYHYETQPLPNPLSWYFHRLPRGFQRLSVLFSHFVQVAVPFGLFAPQPVAAVSAALLASQQLWLIVSGNYAWLNWLTVWLGLAGLSDAALRWLPLAPSAPAPPPVSFEAVQWALAAVTLVLSIRPALNLVSRRQRMNYSYNRLHLVNAYGAFGSVGRERYEIVLEGTADRVLTPATVWSEYGFRAKPGDPLRRPPQVAPYHLRLDWLIWFLPFAVGVGPGGIHVRGYETWFLRLIGRLLAGDARTLRLMGANPFAAAPPALVRALLYRYRFTTRAERRQSGAWWHRELLGIYLHPVSLDALRGVERPGAGYDS
jgi:hypothetical protein